MTLNGGYNLLMLAAEEGDLSKIVQLSKRENVNSKNQTGYSALALAIKNGHLEVCKTLITLGADINSCNKAGQSILFIACWKGREDCVKLLIQKGAIINQPDLRGWTPLTIATHNGYINIVQLLLQNGADQDIQDSFGKRTIDRAKSQDVFNLLQASSIEKNMLNDHQTFLKTYRSSQRSQESLNSCNFFDTKTTWIQNQMHQTQSMIETEFQRKKKLRKDLEFQVQQRVKFVGSKIGELASEKIEQELQKSLKEAEKAMRQSCESQLEQTSQIKLDEVAQNMGLRVPQNKLNLEPKFNSQKMKKAFKTVECTKFHNLEELVTINQSNTKQEPFDLQSFLLKFMDKSLETLSSRLGGATAEKADRDITLNLQRLAANIRLELRSSIKQMNQTIKANLVKLIDERLNNILQQNNTDIRGLQHERFIQELKQQMKVSQEQNSSRKAISIANSPIFDIASNSSDRIVSIYLDINLWTNK